MDALEEMMQRMKSEMAMLRNGTGSLAENDVCPICHNTGWKLVPDGGQGTVRECKCGLRQKQIMDSRLSFANIPESFKDMRLASFDETVYKVAESRNRASNAVKAINYWLNDFERMNGKGMGLYMHSKAKGSGKTRMAVSIANELIYEKHIQVKFATSLQILQEIKSTWNKDSQYSESKLLDSLSTTAVLVIDDFGIEQEGKEKAWVNDKFYQIINSRYIDKKITIFTSNASLDNLNYDDRITNRIKERTFQIPFPEESVRDIIAKENLKELINGIRGKA